MNQNFLERFINIKEPEISPMKLDRNSNPNLINEIPQKSDHVSTQYTKLTTSQVPTKKLINLNFQRKFLKLKKPEISKLSKPMSPIKKNLIIEPIRKSHMDSQAVNKYWNLSKNTITRKKVFSSTSYSSV
jgi:hypothetical protein